MMDFTAYFMQHKAVGEIQRQRNDFECHLPFFMSCRYAIIFL
jgi:hypothetical protein